MIKQQEWYWNDQECENQDTQIPIVLGLSKNFNNAAVAISEKLGFKSLDDYVSDMLRENVRRVRRYWTLRKRTHRRNRKTDRIDR
jgi:hypothetical protein